MRSSNKGSINIRVSKADAAFLYALLEAYEGVLNFSTLASEKSLPYRDVHVFCTNSMEDEFFRVMDLVHKEVSYQGM